MGLSDRLKKITAEVRPIDVGSIARQEEYEKHKVTLHKRLVDQIDLDALRRLDPEQQQEHLARLISSMVSESTISLNRQERDALAEEILHEVVGLGPLEPLLSDPSISDILVNGPATIFVERGGRLQRTQLRFRDHEHLIQIINRIVNRIGRRVDETSPMVDARLQDGSRVNAIIPPLSVDGPVLSIRRFGRRPLLMGDLTAHGALTESMREFMSSCVRARLNILISGGTGTGKTTLLNALSAFIPEHERIITIEDAAELQLQQPHVVRLETRPSNVEGQGEVLTRDLVRNSLRMRPDRIIVGEVRSVEILDMLQAMNTGHEGSMATIHANSPRDALTRIGAMVGMAGMPMSEANLSQIVSRALDLIIQLARGVDGKRRIISVTEVTGTEGATIQMQEIFAYRQTGVDAKGNVQGHFSASGVRPRCIDRLERAGITIPATVFAPRID